MLKDAIDKLHIPLGSNLAPVIQVGNNVNSGVALPINNLKLGLEVPFIIKVVDSIPCSNIVALLASYIVLSSDESAHAASSLHMPPPSSHQNSKRIMRKKSSCRIVPETLHFKVTQPGTSCQSASP